MIDTDLEIKSVVSEATTLFERKKYDQALEQFQSALQHFESINDNLNAAEMHNNISVCLLLKSDTQGALEATQGTDLVFEHAGDTKHQALALGNQASAFEDLKQPDEALEIFEKSEDLLKQINEKEYRAIILKRISSIQVKHGKQMQALASMNTALQVEPAPTPKEKSLKKVLNKFFSSIHLKD
jgi:tetratricopeptide (TPR) repeat protein